MANRNTIALDVLLNDLASPGLKKVADSAEQSAKRAEGAFKSSGEGINSTIAWVMTRLNSLAALVGVAFGTYQLVQFTKESIMLAARVETLGVVLNVVGENAGYSRGEMQQFVQEVRGMGITTQAAHDAVIKMAQAQINLTDSAKLARVAQDAAVIGNINSSEAFQRMIDGIRSGEVEILKTIGLSVNFEQAYQKQARQLNKTTEALSEREKAQARANAVLEAGVRIEGAYEASLGTAGKAMLSLKRFVEELQLGFGKMFGGALTEGVNFVTQLLKDMNKQMDDLEKKGAIEKISNLLRGEVKSALLDIQNILGIIYNVSAPILGLVTGMVSPLNKVREGWSYILAIVEPLTRQISMAIAYAKDLFNILELGTKGLAALVAGQWNNAKGFWEQIKAIYANRVKAAIEAEDFDKNGIERSLIARVNAEKKIQESINATTMVDRAAEEAKSQEKAKAAAEANKLREKQEQEEKLRKDREISALQLQLQTMNGMHQNALKIEEEQIDLFVAKQKEAGVLEVDILKDVNTKKYNLAVTAYNQKLDFYEKEAALMRREKGAKFNEEVYWAERLKALEDEFNTAILKNDIETAKERSKLVVEAKKIWEAWVKDTEDKAKKDANINVEATAGILSAYRDMYRDLGKTSNDYWDARETLIEEQALKFYELTRNEVLVEVWAANEKKKLWMEFALKTNDVMAGIKVGLMEMQDNMMTRARAGYEIFRSFAQSSRDVFSSILFDGAKKQLKSFHDYWVSWTDALLKKFVDIVAQMAVEWALGQRLMAQTSTSYGLLGGAGMGAGMAAGSAAAGGTEMMLVPAAGGAAGTYMLMPSGTAAGGDVFATNTPLTIEAFGGSATLGSALGAAGLGYLGGSMLGGAIFGQEKSQWAGLGGGVGALIGLLAGGGPWGALLGGAAGTVIGGVADDIIDTVSDVFDSFGFHSGGMIYAHAGTYLGPHERYIKGKIGEGILSELGVATIGGPDAVSRANRGMPVAKDSEKKSGNTYILQVDGNVIGNEDFVEDMYQKFKKLEAWGH